MASLPTLLFRYVFGWALFLTMLPAALFGLAIYGGKATPYQAKGFRRFAGRIFLLGSILTNNQKLFAWGWGLAGGVSLWA